ncbi:hypothetical protein [Brachybacterium sp. Z12]|uniref:hypothetical protein n=1 Tax=Brachybacterium sp. Z12 TaxID=2759167 RepID=UPI00223BE889|nr:hypothetical protein [Brachybacterium sp. Z12]
MITRRGFAGVAALALAGTLGACSEGSSQLSVELVGEAPASTVLPGQDLAQTALALSSALFAAADAAVIASPDTVAVLAPVSARTGLPCCWSAPTRWSPTRSRDSEPAPW